MDSSAFGGMNALHGFITCLCTSSSVSSLNTSAIWYPSAQNLSDMPPWALWPLYATPASILAFADRDWETTTEVYRYDFFGMDGTTVFRHQKSASGSGLFEATSSTSDITFKTQIQKASGTASEANQYFPLWYSESKHRITVMEIAG